MRTIFFVFFMLFGAPSFAEPSTDRVDGVQPCVEHFSEEGNFFKGRRFETWQEHEGATYASGPWPTERLSKPCIEAEDR